MKDNLKPKNYERIARESSVKNETLTSSRNCSNCFRSSEKEEGIIILKKEKAFDGIEISYGNHWSAKSSNKNLMSSGKKRKKKEEIVTRRKSKKDKMKMRVKKKGSSKSSRVKKKSLSKNMRKEKNTRSSLNFHISGHKKGIFRF